MKHSWLNKSGNSELLIFFAGWSFDAEPFKFLQTDGLDVIVVYDYRDLTFDLDFSGYEKYHLAAWSMGVYIAPLLRDVLPEFTTTVALNGTPMPIDNEFGIPVRTFDLTLKYAADGLKGKFYQNVFFDDAQVEKYWANPVNRTIEDRVEELKALKSWIYDKPVDASGFYQKAYVSEHDKIIPPKNQRNAWDKLGVPVLALPDGHFPFFNFTSWKEICK
ncbi:MAG: DUF452 family protein [Fusobacterium sp.]|nr:DUF452 family protein [Fusobacterium sp.]